MIYIITCISWGCVQHSTAVQPSMALYALYIYTKVWRATSGRRTGGRYTTTDGHTCSRYGGMEDTEGAPAWRQGSVCCTRAHVKLKKSEGRR